ncbi:methyl-accepting chemotaxis protein [Magnetospirillum molischianum]|uniref:Putative methyl-accepting Chemotaxis protein n=1 Tax=Magnetospirillum molischianum DSM 120 TaxID=1150626 RepID=H8FQ09_MAGML|nr:methyl-accepting chemotaxis protein [Magnetospirillum molischianum]CCG40447.1 Putative methyl-accepting Chemotaxis protein [Magnetospirillum molischianum DSM 120]
MRQTANADSSLVRHLIENGQTIARTNALWLSRTDRKSINRAEVAQDLLRVLKDNPGATGVYAGFEPNFDGRDAENVGGAWGDAAGRYLAYAYLKNGAPVVEISPLTGDPAEEFWYNLPIREKRDTITPPFSYEVGGQVTLMVTVVSPIISAGKAVGVSTVDLALSQVQADLATLKPMGIGQVSLISHDKQWVANPDAALRGKPVDNPDLLAALAKTAKGEVSEQTLTDAAGIRYLTVLIPLRFGRAPETWSFMISVPEDFVFADARATQAKLLGAGIVMLLLAATLAVLVGNGIAGPIKSITDAMTRLANGDVGVQIAGAGRGDEIGKMAHAVQIFKDNALAMSEMQQKAIEIEQRNAVERRNLLLETAGSFESEVAGVVRSVGSRASTMQEAAKSMSSIAVQVAGSAEQVSAAADIASNNVQTVAAASEELAASIHEISRQVSDSARVSQCAVQQVDHNRETIAHLTEAANRIGKVVTLISDIASQTNLLALNATIEAARAGDAGKGFAVVAGEVKALANQTARATDEITNQITEVQTTTKKAVEAINDIAKTIDTISSISSQIASAVEEQSAATKEITRSVQQAANGTSTVSNSIAEVNDGTRRNGTEAEQVLVSAEHLAEDIQFLNAKVETFMARIRA